MAEPALETTGTTDPVVKDEEENTQPAGSEETTSPQSEEGEGTVLSKDTSGDTDQTETAPESYEDFTLPEGVELNADLMDKFKPIAKELNLTQDQAQSLVSLQSEAEAADAVAQEEAMEERHAEDLKESKADKEIGGAKFDESVALSVKALDHFASPELREWIAGAAGNNVHVIKFLAKVGALVSEDMIHGGASTGSPKSRAQILFGKTSPN